MANENPSGAAGQEAPLRRLQDRVRERLLPYRRFVQVQQEQLNEARGELVVAEDALLRLRSELGG
mgnify:CR=1 FL=1